MESSKRKYSPRFVDEETLVLIDLIEKYPTIESKETDGSSLAAKNKNWKDLTKEYNSRGLAKERNASTLKNKWKVMKKAAKKQYCEFKRHQNGTGGGLPLEEMDDLYKKILRVAGDRIIEGGKGSPDNDFHETETDRGEIMDTTLTNMLKELRYGEDLEQRKRKKKVNVEPGKSVSTQDFESDSELENEDDPQATPH
ncbi:hypothetical protein M8J76_003182 [Diaphorina citri]|nr:hypothetical protein M8J76_003182 [Diaphorina citri]